MTGLLSSMQASVLSIVNIVQWVAVLYVLLRIVFLGFKIVTQSKNGTEAIQQVKNEGVALAIGLFVVLSCFMLQSFLKTALTTTTGNGHSTVTVDGNTNVWSQ